MDESKCVAALQNENVHQFIIRKQGNQNSTPHFFKRNCHLERSRRLVAG